MQGSTFDTNVQQKMLCALNVTGGAIIVCLSLCNPDHTPLKVLVKLILSLTYKGRCCMQPVYIVKNMKNNLLGNSAIKAFNLLSNVESVDKKVVLQYLLLFNGLGTFAHEYKLN